MHICFNAIDYPMPGKGGGGVANQVRTLGQALVNAGHSVSVVALVRRGEENELIDHGIRVYLVSGGNFHWYLSKIPLLGKALAPAVRELERSSATSHRISVIHSAHPIDVIEGTETAMICTVRGLKDIPSIIRLHGERYTFHKHTPGPAISLGLRLSRVVQRLGIRRARLLIAPSHAHSAVIAEELGADRPPMTIIPNTISTTRLLAGTEASVQAMASIPGLSSEDPVVLYVGRLELNKGIRILLEAVPEVLRRFPNVQFVLVGARHPSLPAEELAMMRNATGAPSRVHLVGEVSPSEIPAWYQRATLSVLPSFYETFGMAALEPMALGVPVVATRAGGLAEVVVNGSSGLLAPAGDSHALAERIALLLEKPDLRRRIADNGRRRAIQLFDVQAHLDQNLRLYRWSSERQLDANEATNHVFFSPHFDDVALSCGGLIHRLRSKGGRVTVVTVFSGQLDEPRPSAFARHLHKKWQLELSSKQRIEEDVNAMQALGVEHIEHWDIQEAAYRCDASGRCLCGSYEELKGVPPPEDVQLVSTLKQRIKDFLASQEKDTAIYFPLALGAHVDHQLLRQVGLELQAERTDGRFYEDWPYAEQYAVSETLNLWLKEECQISVDRKLKAIVQYRSQLPGLGNSITLLRTRLEAYARRVGKTSPAERFWSIPAGYAQRLVETGIQPMHLPLQQIQSKPRIRGLRIFVASLRPKDPRQIMPQTDGPSIELGAEPCCGLLPIGASAANGTAPEVGQERFNANLLHIPLDHCSVALVTAWKLSLSEDGLDKVLDEVFRVLEIGGVFCGRLAVGRRQGGTVIRLNNLLRRYGFVDVSIMPPTSPGTLTLKHWLGRFLGSWSKQIAMPLADGAQAELVFVARRPARRRARAQVARSRRPVRVSARAISPQQVVRSPQG